MSDNDEAADARFTRIPGALIAGIDARANALEEQPHRLAIDGGKAFDAQHIVLNCNALGARREFTRRCEGGNFNDKRFEVVVVVAFFIVVVASPSLMYRLSALGTIVRHLATAVSRT